MGFMHFLLLIPLYLNFLCLNFFFLVSEHFFSSKKFAFFCNFSQEVTLGILLPITLMKARMQNSSLRQEFFKKWIKGLQIYSNFKKDMTTLERKKAIKSSADVAIASTRNATSRWSHALISDVVSRDATNGILVEQILGRKVEKRASTKLISCSKKILRKSHIARRKARRVVPQSATASSIAKKLVKKRTRVLKSLVPGGEDLDEISLIKETLDYIASLRVQVDVMRRFASAAEKLDHSRGHCD